ncbi:MAG TPA: transcription-repair coupling factor [Solirubrobacteraceae bacterium]|nr:transcription-repair coupling factor [Solirubrobacteraceae bacterium]
MKELLARPSVMALARELLEAEDPIYASSSAQPFLIAALAAASAERQAPARMLVVASDDRAARDLRSELATWLGSSSVRLFPSRGVAYEAHILPSPHLVGLRMAALRALLSGADATVAVASAAALCERVPDPQLMPTGLRLRTGERLDLEALLAALADLGYERVEQVQERGQFAVRGGIIDLYPVTAEHAVRADLFGDEVESLRSFSTFTQRSLAPLSEVEIDPAAELGSEQRELVALAAEARAAGEPVPAIDELLAIERFEAPLTLLPPGTSIVLAAEQEEIQGALEDRYEDLAATPQHDGDGRMLYVRPEEVMGELQRRRALRLSARAGQGSGELRAEQATGRARSAAEAEAELERLVRSGYATVLAFPHRGEGERFAYNLARLSARWLGEDAAGEPHSGERGAGALLLAEGELREGFIAPALQLAVIPARRLIARPARARSGALELGRSGRALQSFTDLRTGDIVVHEDHGVARFAGFQTRTVAGVTRDYLYLEYDGDDRVWVPTDQLAKITRYISAAGAQGAALPPLSKLGSKRWDTLKARARHAARELAGELLALYAERARRSGFAFPPDSEWLRELEARFPYKETPDQLAAIEAVKADMEAPRPMDRLICGDVGFGKTEVALRAAFKAASEGKQVLLLAPTTVLVQQHFGNFSERLADYPVRVDFVSRLRSAAEQRAVLAEFAAGAIEILIGTHRLLSRDLRAKDLGLLVIDEEQRFGVRQKELLRAMKLTVDVLSMSATPIPRTLQISLAGLRDISLIETPPVGRRPVNTYVGEYDEELVKRALQREHARGGQSFFVHNRVETIAEVAERLRGLCPGLRVAIAHGQMEEGQLEEVMLGFLRGCAEVLVCTSIIESGLDIPRANTLIVEDADRFGLAQLYQIRGRVGRRRERAYAYLLYDSAAALRPEAAQRLAALSDHTELGSGFALAMRDLEIRGAGDLLGEEQSGHVAALGFELYMQMLEEAVREAEELEGAEQPALEPVRLEIKVDAYVPADYVPYERAKIDLHRRIAQAREIADIELLRQELADRFGPPPEPVETLLVLARLRIMLALAGARSLVFRAERALIAPIELDSAAVRALRDQLPGAIYESGRSQLSLPVAPDGPERCAALLSAAEALLAAQRGSLLGAMR